eukprot:1023368-Rhodomonas_salina.1
MIASASYSACLDHAAYLSFSCSASLTICAAYVSDSTLSTLIRSASPLASDMISAASSHACVKILRLAQTSPQQMSTLAQTPTSKQEVWLSHAAAATAVVVAAAVTPHPQQSSHHLPLFKL